jgi:hypothetical protein
MKRAIRLIAAIIASFTVGIGLNSVHADPKFMDFNGNWQGSGTDRNLPFETTQPTVDADLRTMNSLVSCSGDAGLKKDIRLNIILECLLYPRKRTLDRRCEMSALGQKRTSAGLLVNRIGVRFRAGAYISAV